MEAKEINPFRPPCDASSEMVNVKAFLDRDVSDLMPYVKGALDNVKYFPKGPYVKFVFKSHPVTVDHDCIAIAGFTDDESARECARDVVALLKDIEARKDSIKPDITAEEFGVRQVRVSGLHGLRRGFDQGRDRTGDVPGAC